MVPIFWIFKTQPGRQVLKTRFCLKSKQVSRCLYFIIIQKSLKISRKQNV